MAGLRSSLHLVKTFTTSSIGSSSRSCVSKSRNAGSILTQAQAVRPYSTPPSPPPPSPSPPPQSSAPKADPFRTENPDAPHIPGSSNKKFRPITVFLGLTGVGLFITIYAVVEYYLALPKWPEPVRTPLRRALRARNLKDYERSEGFFREALAAAHALPPSEFDPDPLLKLSGIYITYASLLEEINNRPEAYKVLREGLAQFGPSPLSTDPSSRVSGAWAGGRVLTKEDHVRAIGLSQKLGHLALQSSNATKAQVYPAEEGNGPKNWLDASEKHLSDALTAMLHLGLSNPGTGPDGKRPKVIAGRDVDLPDGHAAPPGEEVVDIQGGSVDKRGLGVTMEALAEIYTRKGEHGIAGNLLIQAISTLLPPKTEERPPIADQCQAAMLMTTVSSHALQPHTAQAIKASRSWSLRALQIADGAIQAAQGGDVNTLICSKAIAVGSYNLGMLAEIDGDLPGALKQFDMSLKVSRDINFAEGKRLASESIRRLRALSNTTR